MLLSLDVAFSHLGWSVFDGGKPIAVGVIEAKAVSGLRLVSDVRADRCANMTKQLLDVIGGYGVKGIIGELPAGSQNATAANQLGWASGMVVSMATFLDLPAEWVGQNDVKKSVVGRLNATKDEIMDRISGHYGWQKDEKRIVVTKEGSKRKGAVSVQATFHVLGGKYPKGEFEHIADSIGVYWASQHRNLCRMFG